MVNDSKFNYWQCFIGSRICNTSFDVKYEKEKRQVPSRSVTYISSTWKDLFSIQRKKFELSVFFHKCEGDQNANLI